jgi:hypothetical protein
MHFLFLFSHFCSIDPNMFRPDDGRVTAETYLGWIEQKYEKEVHSLVKKTENFSENFTFKYSRTSIIRNKGGGPDFG